MDSIANFAESLILGEVDAVKSGKALPPSLATEAHKAPAGKDIRNVEVPDEFMAQILGEDYEPAFTVVSEEEVPEEIVETSTGLLTESTGQELVTLLNEVKTLLKEMTMAATTTGQIGVNLAGPGRKPIKGDPDYSQATPSPLKKHKSNPLQVRKNILKASIRSKVRKK
jgi:hypothetical protein